MRNSTVKYSGACTAIVGMIILAFLGTGYAWDTARDFSGIDMNDYVWLAVLGLVLLVTGALTYIFVEE